MDRSNGEKRTAAHLLRTHAVGFRLTDQELATVDKLRGKMSRGKWIRTTALGRQPVIVPEPNREKWEALSRLSANLNQLTRAVNGGLRSEIPARELFEIREQVTALRNDLLGKK